MKLKKEIKDLISLGEPTVKMLLVLLNKYGFEDFSQSYRSLAKEQRMTFVNVYYHFGKLEKYGFLIADKRDQQKYVYHLNEHIRGLLNE